MPRKKSVLPIPIPENLTIGSQWRDRDPRTFGKRVVRIEALFTFKNGKQEVRYNVVGTKRYHRSQLKRFLKGYVHVLEQAPSGSAV